MRNCWSIDRDQLGEEGVQYFSSLEEVMSLRGEYITRCPISEMILWEIGGTRYYVKRYFRRGKMLRRFLGRSRVRSEWENLQFFQRLGIKTPPLVAWGGERIQGGYDHAGSPWSPGFADSTQAQPRVATQLGMVESGH